MMLIEKNGMETDGLICFMFSLMLDQIPQLSRSFQLPNGGSG